MDDLGNFVEFGRETEDSPEAMQKAYESLEGLMRLLG